MRNYITKPVWSVCISLAMLGVAYTLTCGHWINANRCHGSLDALQKSCVNGSRTEVFPDDIDGKLAQLGIVLPSVAPSLAIYKPVVVVGNLAFVSGHVPRNADGQILSGKLGEDAEVPAGQSAARQCAIGVLASLRAELGTLNRIKRVVKTTGMVNCTADFEQHPEVINGFSQLFVDIWGEENGRGARAAVGMVSLPRGAICEVDVIVELHE